MRTAIPAVAVAATLLMTTTAEATAPATTSNHDAPGAQVYKLSTKKTTLTSALANKGIKIRLAKRGGFVITGYASRCTRLSKTKRRCAYAFTHKLGDAFGLGPQCGTATVTLARKGKALAVGPTPAESCS